MGNIQPKVYKNTKNIKEIFQEIEENLTKYYLF